MIWTWRVCENTLVVFYGYFICFFNVNWRNLSEKKKSVLSIVPQLFFPSTCGPIEFVRSHSKCFRFSWKVFRYALSIPVPSGYERETEGSFFSSERENSLWIDFLCTIYTCIYMCEERKRSDATWKYGRKEKIRTFIIQPEPSPEITYRSSETTITAMPNNPWNQDRDFSFSLPSKFYSKQYFISQLCNALKHSALHLGRSLICRALNFLNIF